MQLGAQGQTTPADNDRGSNSGEGPQAQVRPLTHHSDHTKRIVGLKTFSSPLQPGTRKAAVKILKNFDEAITVDIASLDPEQLYQRPYAG